jgi:hypothetical protein
MTNFQILRFLRIYLFLCRPEYKLFRFGILHDCRIHHFEPPGFFPEFFETSKCQISEILKTGSIKPVLQTDFLVMHGTTQAAQQLRLLRLRSTFPVPWATGPVGFESLWFSHGGTSAARWFIIATAVFPNLRPMWLVQTLSPLTNLHLQNGQNSRRSFFFHSKR